MNYFYICQIVIRKNEEHLRTRKEAISILLLLPYSFSLHSLSHYIKLAVSLGPIMPLKYHFCCWLYDNGQRSGPETKEGVCHLCLGPCQPCHDHLFYSMWTHVKNFTKEEHN